MGAIMEHYMSGALVVRSAPGVANASKVHRPVEKDDLLYLIRSALHEVIDPELGYNIADLGLIYDVVVNDSGETTPGCPAMGYLAEGVKQKVSNISGVKSVEIELTYDPRWMPEMMRPQAKAHFGIGNAAR